MFITTSQGKLCEAISSHSHSTNHPHLITDLILFTDFTVLILSCFLMSYQCLFIYLGFYVAFNTVQVISRRVVGRAEETSTYSSSGFCTVNCRPTASNYQLSHLRPCREPNPGLRDGRPECYHSATVAPLPALNKCLKTGVILGQTLGFTTCVGWIHTQPVLRYTPNLLTIGPARTLECSKIKDGGFSV